MRQVQGAPDGRDPFSAEYAAESVYAPTATGQIAVDVSKLRRHAVDHEKHPVPVSGGRPGGKVLRHGLVGPPQHVVRVLVRPSQVVLRATDKVIASFI
jgi:hypothetical protein